MDSKWLEQQYVTATEWNLATLVDLLFLKSSSQSRIDRQKSICFKMLEICKTLNGMALPSHELFRVELILNAAITEPEGLQGALDRFVQVRRKA